MTGHESLLSTRQDHGCGGNSSGENGDGSGLVVMVYIEFRLVVQHFPIEHSTFS